MIRVNKENRAAGVLENFSEGEKYAEHALRKQLRNRAPEIMPSINSFFTRPERTWIDFSDLVQYGAGEDPRLLSSKLYDVQTSVASKLYCWKNMIVLENKLVVLLTQFVNLWWVVGWATSCLHQLIYVDINHSCSLMSFWRNLEKLRHSKNIQMGKRFWPGVSSRTFLSINPKKVTI